MNMRMIKLNEILTVSANHVVTVSLRVGDPTKTPQVLVAMSDHTTWQVLGATDAEARGHYDRIVSQLNEA